MPTCPNCGGEIDEGYYSCKYCGARLIEGDSLESKVEPSAESEVLNTITKRLDGIKNRDETAVRAVIGECYNKFDDWQPFKRQEAEEALKNEFGAYKVLQNYSYELSDLKVRVFGEVAVATFYLRYKGEIRDSRFTITSRVTTILRRQDSGWKIIHEHFSRFPEETRHRFW